MATNCDYDSQNLFWDPGAGGGAPTEYRLKAGTSPGVYTRTSTINAPTTQATVAEAVGSPGLWYCAVSAWNSDGESGLSNEMEIYVKYKSDAGRSRMVRL